jgi:hypothetical protein
VVAAVTPLTRAGDAPVTPPSARFTFRTADNRVLFLSARILSIRADCVRGVAVEEKPTWALA